VFENRFLRRIFGPKRDEVKGEWRKVHNEECHNLVRWTGHVACMGEEREVYKVLVRKYEGKITQETGAWVGSWDQNGS
jgi:hypothetical protein